MIIPLLSHMNPRSHTQTAAVSSAILVLLRFFLTYDGAIKILAAMTSASHSQRCFFPNKNWLVVWLPFVIFPYIGNVIIPTDVHIFCRGVAQPPTRRSHYLKVPIHGQDARRVFDVDVLQKTWTGAGLRGWWPAAGDGPFCGGKKHGKTVQDGAFQWCLLVYKVHMILVGGLVAIFYFPIYWE